MKTFKLNNYQLGKLKQLGVNYKIIESAKNNTIVEMDDKDSNVLTFVRINNIKENK
jgi:hypothetical protein